MKATKEELLDIIYQSLDEVNEQLPSETRFGSRWRRRSLDGRDGLDSLGLVNFVALVEEKCALNMGSPSH